MQFEKKNINKKTEYITIVNLFEISLDVAFQTKGKYKIRKDFIKLYLNLRVKNKEEMTRCCFLFWFIFPIFN